MNRAASGVAMRLHVAMANLWRDQYNPLRGLTITRAITLLEHARAGRCAEPMWTFHHIEEMDAVLSALVTRRCAAIKKLDWKIAPLVDLPEDVSEEAVEQQVAALKDLYDGVGNLKKAIEFLCLATFRGFAHLEIVKNADGDVIELAPVDQWFWVRQGRDSEWEYNKDSRFGTDRGEPVDLERFIIRECARPVDYIALIAYVRKGMSQKDWDAFVEVFGIPSVFVEMPAMVPADKEDDYLAMAEAVAGGSAGVLPSGAKITTPGSETRGIQPFEPHIRYQDEQVVLAGTGGKLTMLNEATGIGGSQGQVHDDAFDDIADAEAADISELLQERLSVPMLEQMFPGQPVYAEFVIASEEETDAGEFVAGVATLAGAGYKVSPEQIEEKSGYAVIEAPEEPGDDTAGKDGDVVDAPAPPKSGNKYDRLWTLWAQRMLRLADQMRSRGDEESAKNLEKQVKDRLSPSQVETAMKNRYNPNQPRVPAGNSNGGEWTSSGKSAVFTDSDERSKTTSSSGNGAGSGRAGTPEKDGAAGSPGAVDQTPAARAVLAGIARPDADAPTREKVDQIEKERKLLRASNLPRLEVTGEIIGEGGESIVTLSEDGKRVVKFPNPSANAGHDGYGFAIDYNRRGSAGIGIIPGAPSDFLERVETHNRIFNDDIRIEGIGANGNGFAFSQPAIKGREATAKEVDGYLRKKGFEPVKENVKWGNQRISDRTTWYNKKEGVLLTDANTDNFITDGGGNVFAIDVMLATVKPGSQLHDAAEKGIKGKIKNRATPDSLAAVVQRSIAESVGTESAALDAGRAVFARIGELLADEALTDEAALDAVADLARELPAFFPARPGEAEVAALNAAMGSAMVRGVIDSFSKNATTNELN